MSNGGHPIAESLHRRRVGYVCHMTPCDRLPSIIQSGGIFSRTRRAEHLIAEPNEPHYWGTPGKAEDLADYVVCGFMAPWWMCKGHTEELAIIVLDAKAVCCGEGVLFCPTNSARNDYAAGEIKKRSGIEFFDACFPNLDTYQAGDSEIFVPGLVPAHHIRGIVFCDQQALDHWLPIVQAAATAAPQETQYPEEPIKVGTGPVLRFRFPGDFAATTRIRP